MYVQEQPKGSPTKMVTDTWGVPVTDTVSKDTGSRETSRTVYRPRTTNSSLGDGRERVGTDRVVVTPWSRDSRY